MKRSYLLPAPVLLVLACQTRLDVPNEARITCADSSACPEGWRCDEVNSRCVPNDAPAATCGDAVLDAGEECDCGEIEGAHPDTCIGANSDTEPNRCRTTCVWFSCGDNTTDFEETCDDGNNDAGDGCNAECQRELCGNGNPLDPYERLDLGEFCDDGNTVDGDGCSGNCLSNEECGNSYVDRPIGEECDDGNDDAGDGCNDCRFEYCGNGAPPLDPGEVCDDGMQCTNGSGVLIDCTTDLTECDDLCMPRSGDGCSADCLSKETCRNSYVDTDPLLAQPEQCDDGDSRSHDGCSSDCMLELPMWTESRVEDPLEDGRTYAAMAYHERRGRLVLFGGWHERVLNDTWEFDGVAWRRVDIPIAPVARRQHGMVYDRARGRLVMFGGRDEVTNRFDDTWEYDSRWLRMDPAVSPGARNNFAIAYDPVRERTVIFGGSEGTFLNETWEYDGMTWVQRHSQSQPPSERIYSAMAYNPVDSCIVLFGGHDGDEELADTWEYDDGNWAPISTPGTGGTDFPSARSKHSMVYVPERNAVMLYGGYRDGANELDDTWEYDGAAWSPVVDDVAGRRSQHVAAYMGGNVDAMIVFGGWLTPSTYRTETLSYDGTWQILDIPWSPCPRRGASILAYDIGRSRTVMYGGDCGGGTGGSFRGDTWEHDGFGWLPMSPSSSPPNRRWHALAYDSKRGVTVFFGGEESPSVFPADTWEYDGYTWVETTPGGTSPRGRTWPAMVYDEVRECIVLFGGTVEGAANDETWEYDGSAWAPISGASPSARRSAALAFDAVRGVTVLFGGYDDEGALDDTWEYRNDGTWHRVTTTTAPIARSGAGFAFDPARARLILFGGTADGGVVPDDTWEFDGSAWNEVVLAGFPPPPRRSPGMITDSRRRELMLYGGWSALAGGRVGDLWFFGYRSSAPDEHCTNGTDDDTDTFVDCDDPDCSSQIVCTMPCADGSVEQTFANGMVGCAGRVSFADRRSLCASGIRVCSAFDWITWRHGATPTHNYWVDESLARTGSSGDCSVARFGISACVYPARVCTGATDPEGNTCDPVDCGFYTNDPNEYFGGCGDATAGALCCP